MMGASHEALRQNEPQNDVGAPREALLYNVVWAYNFLYPISHLEVEWLYMLFMSE